LVRAASGQQVPKNELAAALIKVIDIYLINSDANRFSTKQLQNSRRLLTNEIERNLTNNFQ